MVPDAARVAACLAIAAACLASQIPAIAGQNSWTSLSAPGSGPGSGSTAIAVHPVDANIIYAGKRNQSQSTTTFNIVRTANGGTSWDTVFTLPAGSEVNHIVIDPTTPTTVYASASGTQGGGAALYRSVNGGTDWTLRNFGLLAEARGLAVDPAHPGTVYAWAADGIHKSTNSGDSWTLVHAGFMTSLAIDPANGNVLVGTDAGLLRRSTDGGSNWSTVHSGLQILALAFQGSTGIVYAGSRIEGGLYRSVDGGATWTNLASRYIGPAYDPRFSGGVSPIVSLAVGSGPQPPLMASIGTCGAYKSLDGGLTFSDANAGLQLLSAESHCHTSSANHVVHSPAAPGDYFAAFMAEPHVAKHTLTTSALPPACLLTATPTSVPQGGSSTLTTYCSPAATSYAWSLNTGFSSAAPSGTVTPTQTTTYTVQGVNANGPGAFESVIVYAPGPRTVNLSTRAQVLTGNDVMIAGFVIGSVNGNKTVAIVATGPSLAAHGVVSPLADPTIQLNGPFGPVMVNDNWQTGPNAAQLQALGFAPPDALEAAIFLNLAPGAYTAIVRGANGGTGTAVVGIYEIDAPEVPLINVSTRARVLTGNDVMIGGFVVDGAGPQTMAIVATGPSLVAHGITSPLANPTISLVRSSDQVVLATNDDWQTHSNAAQLQAAGFAPTNPLESGIYTTLPPGAYTVIVQGVGGGTGVGVVGIYRAN